MQAISALSLGTPVPSERTHLVIQREGTATCPPIYIMRISQEDLRKIAVLAGQGEVGEMTSLVNRYAEKERATTGWILLECKDDFHQTAAHIAAKAGQTGECAHNKPIFLCPSS